MNRIEKRRKRTVNNPLNMDGRVILFIVERPVRLTAEQIGGIKTDFFGIKGITKGRLLKKYNITINIVPNQALTKKGILVRMGKGKGKWVTDVKFLTQGEIVAVLRSKGMKPIITRDFDRILNKYPFLTLRAI